MEIKNIGDVSVSFNTTIKCPECEAGFTTHTTAVVVRCPYCDETFDLDDAEAALVLGPKR